MLNDDIIVNRSIAAGRYIFLDNLVEVPFSCLMLQFPICLQSYINFNHILVYCHCVIHGNFPMGLDGNSAVKIERGGVSYSIR